MNYSEKNIAGLPVFELKGKIVEDSECREMADRMMEVIGTGQSSLILDFEKVNRVNRAGKGAIIQCISRLLRAGGDLRLVGVHDKVAHYLRVTKLETVLKIYNSIDEISSLSTRTKLVI